MREFVFPANLQRLLRGAWRSYRGRPRGQRGDLLYPTRPILEVAYHASFLREEDRPLRFRLAVTSEEDARAEEAKGARLLELEKPRPFTPEELRRLAPALDFTQTLICVDPPSAASPAGPKIWGLLAIGSEMWAFSHRRAKTAMLIPSCLEVSSQKPGQLVCAREGAMLLMLEGGLVHQPPRVAGFARPLKAALERPIANLTEAVHKFVAEVPVAEVRRHSEYVINRFVDKLILAFHEQSHGGALLIVPEGANIKKLIKFKYALKPFSPEIWYLLQLHLARELQQHCAVLDTEVEDAERALDDVVEVVAAATGVDGAVVITDEFRVLGFGAEIIARGLKPESVYAGTPANPDRLVAQSIEASGTRHRSAARFAYRCEGAVAIVVSQDGAAKSIARVGRRVVSISHQADRGYAH